MTTELNIELSQVEVLTSFEFKKVKQQFQLYDTFLLLTAVIKA